LPTDEIYHFYAGDPVIMLQLHPDGNGEMLTIGNNLSDCELPQVVAPKYCWQGAELKKGGTFAFLGTTMAPGFDFDDFTEPDVDALVEKYPDFARQIPKFT